MISDREHARLARELIAACGGPEEASANCRVHKSKLSGYQNPCDPSFMPADVIGCLEQYCGQPIYSGALFGQFDPATARVGYKDAACDLAQEAMDLQRDIRDFGEALTPSQIERLAADERRIEQALETARAARRAAEGTGSITPIRRAGS